MFEEPAPRERSKVILGVVAALVVTTGLGVLAFALGSWAYQYRRYSLHQRRLRQLVERSATAPQVQAELLADRAKVAVALPAQHRELLILVDQLAPEKAPEVVAKAKQWGTVQAFRVDDVLYVLYFDQAGTLRDFVVAVPPRQKRSAG